MKFKPVLLMLGAIASAGVITSTIALSSVNTAQAQTNPQQSSQKHRGGWAALNLTEQQKAQMKQIRTQTQAQIQAVFTPEQLSKLQAAKGQRGNRRELMSSLGLSEAQKAQIKSIRESAKNQMKAILTPEQQQQMQSMHKHKR